MTFHLGPSSSLAHSRARFHGCTIFPHRKITRKNCLIGDRHYLNCVLFDGFVGIHPRERADVDDCCHRSRGATHSCQSVALQKQTRVEEEISERDSLYFGGDEFSRARLRVSCVWLCAARDVRKIHFTR